jgi:hypothetical protein
VDKRFSRLRSRNPEVLHGLLSAVDFVSTKHSSLFNKSEIHRNFNLQNIDAVPVACELGHRLRHDIWLLLCVLWSFLVAARWIVTYEFQEKRDIEAAALVTHPFDEGMLFVIDLRLLDG